MDISYPMKHYNFVYLKINYIEVILLQSSIPKNWMIILKQHTYIPVTNIQNTIYINNSKLQLDKVKCKIYCLHLINNIIHTPKTITKRENIYTCFKDQISGKKFLKCHFYVLDTQQFKPFNTK